MALESKSTVYAEMIYLFRIVGRADQEPIGPFCSIQLRPLQLALGRRNFRKKYGCSRSSIGLPTIS